MTTVPDAMALAIEWCHLLLDLGYSRTQVAASQNVSAAMLSYWMTRHRPMPEDRQLALIDHGSAEFVRIVNEALDGDAEARARIVRAAPRLRKMEQQNLAVMAAVCQFLQDHCKAIGQLASSIKPDPMALRQFLSAVEEPAMEMTELIRDLHTTLLLGDTFRNIVKDASRWEKEDWFAEARPEREVVR